MLRRMFCPGLAWIASLVAFASAATIQAERADLILHSGKIAVVDASFGVAEAIAVKDGKILRVGKDADILPLKGDGTELVNLRGKLVIPGLMDSHTHAAGAALTEFDHEIPTMETIADVLAYVRTRAEVVPAGEWIVVQQVFITRLKEKRYPTRAELDAAAPHHPVMFRTGPDVSLNSLALQQSGIGRDFQVSDGGSGFAEKDPATGEPTGILRNCSRYVKVRNSARQATAEEHEARIKQLFSDYNRMGITSICDRDASFESLERYRALRDRGELSVRVSCSMGVASVGELAKIEERIRSVARHELFTQPDDFLRIIGVKTYLDGGMLTGSAYMREPWGVSGLYNITDPQYRGVQFIPADRLLGMARAAVSSGLQFTAHSQGDAAVLALLDAYEALAKEGLPVAETRACVTHASFMSEEAVARGKKLGVSFDLQPAWLYMDTATLVGHFGLPRLRWFIPLRSMMAAGVTVGGGSDHMQKIGPRRSNNPYDPFLGMSVAIRRNARGYEDRLYPEEALSREEALRLYTINNARVLRCERERGSLHPGKLADMVVLVTDLLTCPEEDVEKTEVWRTYVGGKLVYERR
jgi:predicted amidohydrolase YtcJ